MIGENFTRHNRHDEHLEKMKNDLENLRDEWGEEYYGQCDINKLNDIEEKIKKLKYYMYVYVANRNSIEYTREFERKYLW